MESLRPERDELDQFHSRKKGGGKSAASKGGSKSSGVQQQESRTGLLLFLCFFLLAVCVFMGWLYMNQQHEMRSLRADLEDAAGFIGQSKLLLARLEGDLNETGASIEESGTEVQKKLAFLDSEMRKLWGVSNDRNKKDIADNQAAIEKLEQLSASVRSEQKSLQAGMAALKSAQEKAIGTTEKELAGLRSSVAVATSEVGLTRDMIDNEITALRSELEKLSSLRAELQENKKTIASIDASRRQLNERVVGLESQIRKLDKQLSAAMSPK